MTENQFFEAMHSSIVDYTSMFGNNDPNFSNFKEASGKMITWHRLADEVIPLKGTISYYKDVLKAEPRAHDLYRFFEAPGVAHYYSGLGPSSNGVMS